MRCQEALAYDLIYALGVRSGTGCGSHHVAVVDELCLS